MKKCTHRLPLHRYKVSWHFKSTCIALLFSLLCFQNSFAQKQMERLNRGVVAVRSSASQVFVSWRMFGTDPTTIAFNVYRGSTKLNASPVTNSTNYVDNVTTNASYTVRPVVNDVEQAPSEAASVWAQQYLSVPIQRPAGGTTPAGEAYTYSANDCSVGDMDGDGQYEIIVKWDPSNSKDNSQTGYTGNVYIDAYKMNGTRLWRIDLGRNIRAGSHYTQFMVYDLDGDGKAEIAMKTAPGTRDGLNTLLSNGPAAADNDAADYRTTTGDRIGYILSGPEYLTVFNGLTGDEMATVNYEPGRAPANGWGNTGESHNRVDRFVAAVAYLDGQRPSLVMGRGYYGRLVRVAYDWRDGRLTRRWTFDSNTSGNGSYAGQGNHQLSVGDVDGNGTDEVVNGSSAIRGNGTGLYANGLGHGDALHMSDMDPDRPGQEVWQPHESPSSYGNYGLEFRDARTGQPLWGVRGTGDIGRGMAADIDPRYKGYELWGSTGGLYTVKGVQISTTKPSVNFGLWWDGDLQREILDGTKLDKWNSSTNSVGRLYTFYQNGTATDINGTKANPNLSGDILGDWREEAIYHSSDNNNLLIFTTTIPTTTRIYTLMHDPQYRVAIAWQNTAYNQPPHPSFYLGGGMAAPPTPNIVLVGGGTTNPSTTTIANGTYTIINERSGKLFDVPNSSTANGDIIQQWAASGATNQQWIVTGISGGYYSIRAVNSGKSLDINERLLTDGTPAIQWTASSTATNQQFQIIDQGSDLFSIVARHSGKCLEIASGSLADGAQVQQWTCGTGTNQRFRFAPVSASTVASRGIGSFEEASAINKFVVYPNPSAQAFQVQSKGAFSYVITDQIGRTYEKGVGNKRLAIGNKLKPGVYILQVQAGDESKIIKLVKN